MLAEGGEGGKEGALARGKHTFIAPRLARTRTGQSKGGHGRHEQAHLLDKTLTTVHSGLKRSGLRHDGGDEKEEGASITFAAHTGQHNTRRTFCASKPLRRFCACCSRRMIKGRPYSSKTKDMAAAVGGRGRAFFSSSKFLFYRKKQKGAVLLLFAVCGAGGLAWGGPLARGGGGGGAG